MKDPWKDIQEQLKAIRQADNNASDLAWADAVEPILSDARALLAVKEAAEKIAPMFNEVVWDEHERPLQREFNDALAALPAHLRGE